jgi:mono/diheme cytochrome c family protein
MRKVVLSLAALGAFSFGGFWILTTPKPVDPALLAGVSGDAAAGQAIFHAAGCASCHKGPDRQADPLVLSGGRAFVTEFGTFHAPNISPDPVHGIGGWSLPDFANAVMRGISPQGAHYYPAFPYAAYGKAQVQDIADLHAYMLTLPADATPDKPHDLAFPFTLRRGLGLWKALFIDPDWIAPAPTPELERGRYLVEALAHCAECHTPRNALGGLDVANWMAGAPNPSGQGRIPALMGEKFTWTEFDISAYLETGFTPQFDVVGGSMADVVSNLQNLDKSDLDAIAAYIVALRAPAR